jgi:hypothetical protein
VRHFHGETKIRRRRGSSPSAYGGTHPAKRRPSNGGRGEHALHKLLSFRKKTSGGVPEPVSMHLSGLTALPSSPAPSSSLETLAEHMGGRTQTTARGRGRAPTTVLWARFKEGTGNVLQLPPPPHSFFGARVLARVSKQTFFP